MSQENMEKVGNLTDEELKTARGCKREEDEITYRIGHLQREIISLSIMAEEKRQDGIDLLKTIKDRLNLEDGLTISINMNGEVLVKKE
jgi:hypothetical protein